MRLYSYNLNILEIKKIILPDLQYTGKNYLISREIDFQDGRFTVISYRKLSNKTPYCYAIFTGWLCYFGLVHFTDIFKTVPELRSDVKTMSSVLSVLSFNMLLFIHWIILLIINNTRYCSSIEMSFMGSKN